MGGSVSRLWEKDTGNRRTNAAVLPLRLQLPGTGRACLCEFVCLTSGEQGTCTACCLSECISFAPEKIFA